MAGGKTGSLSKPAFLYPMGAVGVLAIGFFIYYFAFTSKQETSLNQRALRALSDVADGFHNRVLNLATVVGQAGKKQDQYDDPKNKPPDFDRVSFKNYLKRQAPDLVPDEHKLTTTQCEPKDTKIE